MSRHLTRNQHRSTAFELAAAILVIALIFIAAAAPAFSRAATPKAFASVRLKHGQTLWELAKSHPVQGMSTEQVVELIKRESGLRTTPAEGDVVRLPSPLLDGAVCAR